jgi:hypothetical protein
VSSAATIHLRVTAVTVEGDWPDAYRFNLPETYPFAV